MHVDYLHRIVHVVLYSRPLIVVVTVGRRQASWEFGSSAVDKAGKGYVNLIADILV